MAVVSKATTSATTTISIATPPATLDETGYEGVTTWIPLGDVSSMGTYGGQTTVVTHIPVDTATVVKRSGSVNYGQMSLTIARHSGTDSDALIAAFNDRLPRAFRVVLPTVVGEQDFFTAVVTSIQTNVQGADNILETNVTLELDTAVITASV